SLERRDSNQDLRYWKAAIISSYWLGSRLYPAKDVLSRHSQIAAFNPDIDAGVSYQQTRSHLILRRHNSETSQIKQRSQGCAGKKTRREVSKHLIAMTTVAPKKLANQAVTEFACFTRAGPNKNAITVSAEILPAPKIRTINATIRNAKGAAATNLSGSEKKESSASRSPITYAMVRFAVRTRAVIREARPNARKMPPANSTQAMTTAICAGIGKPRVAKYSPTLER